MTMSEPICLLCLRKHWTQDKYKHTCDAFPNGIPDSIWRGTFDHRNAWPKNKEYPNGDNGLRFKVS